MAERWADAPRVVVDAASLREPAGLVGRLHAAWAGRVALVVELEVDPASFRSPATDAAPVWSLGAGHTVWHDSLQFLVWANNYDARSGEPVWWWARKAVRLGATELAEPPGDVVLPDGRPAWVDGGPRTPFELPLAGAEVISAETVESGRLDVQPAPRAPVADLAPDQLAAVAHRTGPARIVAPAGSGKTRVLTERLRHLLVDRAYEPERVLALAYNREAREELQARTSGLGARVATLNAWGYELVARARGGRPPVLSERDVRHILERLVPRQRRRVNTDPLGRYIEGLSLVRLGLRDPAVVEDEMGDVPGLAASFDPYRAELAARGALDFDEQVYGAIEALLRDGELRRSEQARHRHLLVDELQDLTPAHVLLARLVSAPAYDVFGVGDDDQTIYDHVGADPAHLLEYGSLFPGAASHALVRNHRCPAVVTEAAAGLLAHNRRRVDKRIEPGPGVSLDRSALELRTHPGPTGATMLTEAVQAWLAPGGPAAGEPGSVAVLARVQSMLLAPHVALVAAGVPIRSVLDEGVLNRLGVRAALAYLRLAASPAAFAPADLVEVHRRPSRGLPGWAERWLARCRSITDLRRAAARVDDERVAGRLDGLADDIDVLGARARQGADTAGLLAAVRDDVGLGSAMVLLDSTGGSAGSHLDDLEALGQVAGLHPDPSGFEAWLRAALGLPSEHGAAAVTLSTVHRVKGREWPCVAVVGVTDGIVPHRLANDVEAERRVLHVAVTRGSASVLVLGDETRRSPLLDELAGLTPRRPVRTAAAPGTRPGERTAVTGGPARGVRGRADHEADLDDPAVAARAAALRAWRRGRAQADGVPAYVVCSDAQLGGIAAANPVTLAELRACPGIGPARLESYGEQILVVLGSADAEPRGEVDGGSGG